VPLDCGEFAAALEPWLDVALVAGELVEDELAGGGVAPPPKNENTCPSTEVKPPEADDDRLPPDPPLAPLEPELELEAGEPDDLAALAEAALDLALEDATAVETSRAPGVVEGSLQAVVLGPAWPGGAPPGSGTQALGFDGSVSLTPGWLGPSQA
jgi:hypothetical protein